MFRTMTIVALMAAFPLAGCPSAEASSLQRMGGQPSGVTRIAPVHHQDEAMRRNTLTSLFLTVMTRAGVTAEADVRAFGAVAHEAAGVFRKSLSGGRGRGERGALLERELGDYLRAFEDEYRRAPAGAEGADAKGAAVNRLIDALFTAADRAGVAPSELDAAFLRAAAAAEVCIGGLPAAKRLDLADRELALLLLKTAVGQLHRRAVVTGTASALASLGAAEEITARFAMIDGITRNILKQELARLERFLGDPLNITSPAVLHGEQFNLEAISDISLMLYFLEQFLQADHTDRLLATLAERMVGMGGIMTGITPERLRESGIVEDPLRLTVFAAYDSVTPELPLSYQPVAGLAEELFALGGELPVPPDFTLFAAPYRALFQLRHDLLLCDRIAFAERNAVEEAAIALSRPPTVGERLVVSEADRKRRSAVLAVIGGVADGYKSALVNLLTGWVR